MATAVAMSAALLPDGRATGGSPSSSTAEITRDAIVGGTAEFRDLSREVYCILGMPIDALEMGAVVRGIEATAASAAAFLISTPNLSFLISYQDDATFRESLLMSDLCPADGVPIIWLARLLGLPVKHKVSGSDLFEALKAHRRSARPLKVCLFGGRAGVGATASRVLNERPTGLRCVSAIDPGFGTVEEMSRDDLIDQINVSGADFLVASLGSVKGQLWLLRNHHRLRIPVRAHLGATINFQAGTIKRAPAAVRKVGLEWLWRIKEEPYLWRRYGHDGLALLRLAVTRGLPLAVMLRWQKRKRGGALSIKRFQDSSAMILRLSGNATAEHIDTAIDAFSGALKLNQEILIDFSATQTIDCRFLGLLLMVRKQLKARGRIPKLTGLSPRLKRLFHLSCVDFLLPSSSQP